jgi:hypothetical protein
VTLAGDLIDLPQRLTEQDETDIFHLLGETAVERLIPREVSHPMHVLLRGMTHTRIKRTCNQIVAQRTDKQPRLWQFAGYDEQLEPALADLAEDILQLQRHRERADYDARAIVTELDALEQVLRALRAQNTLLKGLPDPQWTLFLTSIVAADRKEDR